ncbi:MAG: T9SS type A sorting domain-containing protein, partial [Flavobacteriales bacterium]
AIRVYTGIPHKPNIGGGGTILNSSYGDGVPITRLEGTGNGNNFLDISAESEADILANNIAQELTYVPGRGPVDIKIIDPLNVPAADFELRLAPEEDLDLSPGDEAYWVLTNLTMLEDADPANDEQAVYTSKQTIDVLTEEVLLEWGISIVFHQHEYTDSGRFTTPVGQGRIRFSDPSRPWLQGISDQEGFSELNWIRSGTQNAEGGLPEEVVFNDQRPGDPLDEDQLYEGILGGTWAPYCLVAGTDVVTPEGSNESFFSPSVAPTTAAFAGVLQNDNSISLIGNVDVVITSDKSKWTRCMVFEMQPNEDLAENLTGQTPAKMEPRRHPSVDKNGRTVAEGGNAAEATLNGAQPNGMGWFPGYAIDVGTGERLNMAFGEDSWMAADNGRDMIWNPSSRIVSPLGTTVYAGGQHWIYVFKNHRYEEANDALMPAYDQGQYIYERFQNGGTTDIRRVFRAATWVGSALLNDDYSLLPIEQGLIPNDVRISLRVSKEYMKYSPSQFDFNDFSTSDNFWNPLYRFSTRNQATVVGQTAVVESLLDEINVVPNPYYAYSQYETSKLDNRVKITNLPEVCTVSIYNLTGTLIRQYQKADPTTSLDWDLKNEVNVPIAGGVYLIHIEVPEVGEKVLKWFGVMRPTDLDNF